MDEDSSIDRKLDDIFREFDDLFRAGSFNDADAKLRGVNVAETPTDLLLGYLTICLPARSRLPSYAKLFSDVESILKERQEYSPELLSGLEPFPA